MCLEASAIGRLLGESVRSPTVVQTHPRRDWDEDDVPGDLFSTI